MFDDLIPAKETKRRLFADLIPDEAPATEDFDSNLAWTQAKFPNITKPEATRMVAEKLRRQIPADPTAFDAFTGTLSELPGEVVKSVVRTGATSPLRLVSRTADWLTHDSAPAKHTPLALERAATTLDAVTETAFPSPDQPGLEHSVAQGVGQIGTMFGGGGLLKAAGAGTKLISGGMIAQMGAAEFDDAFEASVARGDDRDTAFAKALGYGSVAALIENRLGAGRLWRQMFGAPELAAKKLTALGVSRAVGSNVLAGGIEEGAQRAAQNLIVEEKPSMTGVLDEAIPGAIIEGAMGMPVSVGNRMAQGQKYNQEKELLDFAVNESALQATFPTRGQSGLVANRTKDQSFERTGLFDDLIPKSPQSQTTKSPQNSDSEFGLTQQKPPGAVQATSPAPAASLNVEGQTERVRAELAALPGANEDLNRTVPALTSEQTDAGLREAPQDDNVPATKADLKALADFIQNGGQNPFAKPSGQPDVTAKSPQTITGSNVQTGTEMPVSPLAGGATAKPKTNGDIRAEAAAFAAEHSRSEYEQSPYTNIYDWDLARIEAKDRGIPLKATFEVSDRYDNAVEHVDAMRQEVAAEQFDIRSLLTKQRPPATPDFVAPETPAATKIEIKKGDTVSVVTRKGAKPKAARVIQMQPDGSAQVVVAGEQTARWLTKDQITPSRRAVTLQAKADELAGFAPEQQTQIKERAAEFRQLVEDYAPQLEWTPAEAYDESFGTDTKDVGFRKAELRTNAIRQAMRAVFPNGQENSQVDQANALPALERYLKEKFPGDNSIAKRRALEEFSRSEANPEQTASIERDQAVLDQLAARYPGKAFLQGLRAVGRSTARGQSKLDAQPGGKSSGKGALPAAGASAVTELERIFGVRIIFVQDAKFAGVKPAGVKLILINTKAKAPMMALAGHELLHHIASTYPGLYADFKQGAAALLKNNAQFRAQLERNGYADLTDDVVTEEMLADVLGDAVLDPVFLQELAKAEPNLFKRFARTAVKWLEKLIAKAKALTGFDSAQYVTDLTEMRERLLNLLRDAGQQTQFDRAGIQQEVTENTEQVDNFSKPEKPLLELTREQFNRKYSIHFDVRDGAESRVESIMRDGLRSGMVSNDVDNQTPESVFAKRAPARGWARWQGADKPGAIAYVIRDTDLRNSTYIKPNTKPVAVVRLTKENQSVYEALQEQGGDRFSMGDFNGRELGANGVLDDPSQSSGQEFWLNSSGKYHSAPRGHDAKANQLLNRENLGIKPGQNSSMALMDKGFFRVVRDWVGKTVHAEGIKLNAQQRAALEQLGIIRGYNVVAYDMTGSYPQRIYSPPQNDAKDSFSLEGGDMFGFDAPESVAEQKARLKAEADAQKLKKAKDAMQERAGARLIGKDLDTTQEMFGGEVKRDKSGQGDMFSLEGERNLVAVHNTRADGLLHAMKMGGLPVPSIAIVRADKAVLDGFGDITLVGTPELVTPSKDTKVLNADAYSPRYPKVDIVISYGDGKKVTAAFQKYRDEVPAAPGDYEWQASQVTDRITDRGWRELQYSSLARYAFLRDKGLMEAPAAGADIEAVRHEVDRRTKGLESEIAAWAELKVKNLVPVSEKIFKGFNNSGNRSYTPHTLENVVKIMKKGFADAEGFNYGVGSVRAKTGKQFRSLEGIQKDRDKIITKAEMEAIKTEVDKEFGELHDSAMTYRQGGKNSGFGTLDAFSDDLKAMAEGGAENARYLREMYPGGEPLEKMRAFLDKLRNLPTEYFEAKPRRAVQLQEFSGAVVPEGTSPELIKQLQRRGLTVSTYKKGDAEDRRRAVSEVAQERGDMFSLPKPEDQSEFAKVQADISAAEAELMAAIRQTVLPGDQRQGTRAEVFAAKNDAHRKLRALLAKQLKMMTDIRNLDAARSPEETANLISQTVSLLNSIQDDISERTAKSEAVPADLTKLRTDLQERLAMLKGWTDSQEDEARGGPVEKATESSRGRFLALESATDPQHKTFGEWWQTIKNGLRYLTSPIPELPLTGERAEKSALFRRGYRLFAVENNRVRKEAADRVNQVLEPLTKLGRTPASNEALQRYFKLGEARERAAMDPARRSAIAKQMLALEESTLNKDPFNLFRRLVLYKDLRWRGTYLKNDQGKPITLPMGLTVDEVASELRRTYKLIEQHPDGLAITEALRRHYKLTDDLQKSILEHGEIIPESLRNPLYFPHHVIDSWSGNIARVRPSTEEDFRKYLIAPTGSAKLIQTDYLKAMYLHTADVLAHNARVDLVDKYWKPYDISEQLKAQHGDKWNLPWNIPPGYKVFTPFNKLPLRMDYVLSREVLADKLGILFNDGDLRERMGDTGKVLKVKPEDLHAAMVAGEKIQWVLPAEIADALTGIARREAAASNPGLGHAIGLPFRAVNNFWKKTKLFAPWNWIRYEYGNLSTDAIDKVLAADPGAGKYLSRAAKEIWNADTGQQSPEYQAAAREGVFDTITAGEAGELTKLPEFKAFLTGNEAKWEKVRSFLERPMRGSKFRESVFRYAKFLADVERLRAGKEPTYAGAFHGDIEALGEDVDGQRRMLEGDELIYAKAAEISLKTYGDYNSLGVAGQWLRQYAVPFWSWQDVNFRYHANQVRNIADGLLGKTGPDLNTARKAALRYAGVRVVSTLLAIGIAKELWNQFGGPMLGLWDDDDDLEAKLSEADRRRGHLILGKDKDGKVLVVYTPSAWSDVAEWMGGQNMKRLFMEYVRGQITLDQFVKDYAKQMPRDVLNKLGQSLGPLGKAPYETISGKSTFPDVLDQRTIPESERWWRLVGTLTDDRAVNVLRGAFDQDYYSQPATEQLQQIILQIRRRDPEQWSYYEAREDAADWKESRTGKRFEQGSYDAPEAQALRNFRKAIYRGDVASAERFYGRLLQFGYTAERLDASIRNQAPLSDLNESERAEYVKTLTAKQKQELELATKYYNRIKALDGREKQLFPKKGQKPSPKPELLKRIVEDQSRNK